MLGTCVCTHFNNQTHCFLMLCYGDTPSLTTCTLYIYLLPPPLLTHYSGWPLVGAYTHMYASIIQHTCMLHRNSWKYVLSTPLTSKLHNMWHEFLHLHTDMHAHPTLLGGGNTDTFMPRSVQCTYWLPLTSKSIYTLLYKCRWLFSWVYTHYITPSVHTDTRMQARHSL